MKKAILASIVLLIWATPGIAQWSTDPAQNLQILRGSVYPQMIADGTGGAIIVGVSFTVRPHLYAQRVDQLGKILWSQSLVGIQVSDAGVQQAWLGSSLRHLLIPDGTGGAYVAFHAFWVVGQYPEPPEEIYTYRVYVQHLDADGNLLFGSEGLPVLYRAPVDTSHQILSALIPDNTGGSYVIFTDERGPEGAGWYITRINSDGTQPWGTAKKLAGMRFDSELISYEDGLGGFCIYELAVETIPPGIFKDHFLRINSAGEIVLFKEIEIGVPPYGFAYDYDFVHENGEAIFVWRDFRTDSVRIQKLDRDGNKLWGNQPLLFDYDRAIFADKDYRGGMFIYTQSTLNFTNTHLKHVSSSGSIEWEKPIKNIVAIAADTSSNLFYTTTAFPSPEKYIQKLSFAGETFWDSTGVVLSTRQWFTRTCMISDEEGGAIICWDENVPARGVWAQQINSEGMLGTITAVNTRRDNNFISTNRFYPNFPNPFNATTIFSYEMTSLSHVELTIYDLLGAPVVTLVDADQAAGKYKVRWDGRDAQGRAAPSGVYFAHFKSDQQTQIHKLVLIR